MFTKSTHLQDASDQLENSYIKLKGLFGLIDAKGMDHVTTYIVFTVFSLFSIVHMYNVFAY